MVGIIGDPCLRSLASLRELHERVQVYTGSFELPEPDEELLAMVDRIVEAAR